MFGENYVQEIVEKAPLMPSDIQWRFIGHVQSNKARQLVAGVPNLTAVETVDSVKLANKLDAAVAECAAARMKAFGLSTNPPLQVMVQVNTSGEQSKFGVDPGDALALAKHIHETCGSLIFQGLMTIGMPDYTSKPEKYVWAGFPKAADSRAFPYSYQKGRLLPLPIWGARKCVIHITKD